MNFQTAAEFRHATREWLHRPTNGRARQQLEAAELMPPPIHSNEVEFISAAKINVIGNL